MKTLLIEDDPIKLKAIKDFLNESLEISPVEICMSYQSGLKLILTQKYSFILLDMQLPNYDIKSGENGYKHRPLAGLDILREIKRKKVNCKVVIITQYQTFGEDAKFTSLSDWDDSLSKQFSGIYIETIFYNPKTSSWKSELTSVIKNKLS